MNENELSYQAVGTTLRNLAPVHFAQPLTYLKQAGKKLALLIHFNKKLLKDGIHRIVNNL